MNQPEDARVDLATTRLQSGLRDSRRAMRPRAFDLATGLHEAETEFTQVTQYGATDEFRASDLDATYDTARRLRKFTEIIEDDLGVSIGSSKFGRVATGLSTLSSIGSILISGQNLLNAATVLVRRQEQKQSLQAVSRTHFTSFYTALGIFAINCTLYATPLNFKTAWRGTRYINNRFLYHLRGFSKNLHRFAMSELHFLIRELLPKALRRPVKFTEYIVTLSVDTFNQIREYGTLNAQNAYSTLEGIVEEFTTFAHEAFEYSLPKKTTQQLTQDAILALPSLSPGLPFNQQAIHPQQ